MLRSIHKMKHLAYLTAITALWVVLILMLTDKGPYWDYLDEVDLYVRAAKYETCLSQSQELETAVRACVETPAPSECHRLPALSDNVRGCLEHFEM